MRFDDADHDVDILPLQPMGFLQHFVGLADAGREAEIDFQPATLPLANERQKMFGPLMGVVGGHGVARGLQAEWLQATGRAGRCDRRSLSAGLSPVASFVRHSEFVILAGWPFDAGRVIVNFVPAPAGFRR